MGMEVKIRKKFKDFSLDVEFGTNGGRMGILGPSGCGKSMTLKCVAGVETPDEGYIAVNGRVLFDSENGINVRPQKRRVGYLFQDYALFPNMTVWENLACGLDSSTGRADRNRKIGDMLDLCHLTGLGDRYPSQLSGGQQQRVALARILANEPEVVLLDEPFSSLDAHLSERMQTQLLDVLKHFMDDAVLVTHNRNEAYRICAQILAMDEGRILISGDTREVFRNPQYLKVAMLTGCKNLSRAVKSGEYEVTALDWDMRLRTATPVPDDTTAVGVHSHDFRPATVAETHNLIRISVLETTEGPFERSVAFRRAGGEGEGARCELRWTFVKNPVECPLPEYLSVHPERILLLK